MCEDSRYTKPTVIYRGPNADVKLIESLIKEQNEIREILSHIETMPEHEGLVDNFKYCCLCKKEFSLYDRTYTKIVTHHNQVTGEIIGAAFHLCGKLPAIFIKFKIVVCQHFELEESKICRLGKG